MLDHEGGLDILAQLLAELTARDGEQLDRREMQEPGWSCFPSCDEPHERYKFHHFLFRDSLVFHNNSWILMVFLQIVSIVEFY